MSTGIKERRKGQRGDKTMLDAWVPATEAAVNARARAAGGPEMSNSILEAAEAGANSTQSMVAAAAGRHGWESDPWGTWTQARPRPSSSRAQ